MEIIEEDDGEIKQLMLRISRKEITLCETCDTFFDYVPLVKACDECKKKKQREYNQRPEVKAKVRERKERNKKPTQRQPSQKRRRVVAALDSRERMKKAMQNLGMTEEMRLYFEE